MVLCVRAGRYTLLCTWIIYYSSSPRLYAECAYKIIYIFFIGWLFDICVHVNALHTRQVHKCAITFRQISVGEEYYTTSCNLYYCNGTEKGGNRAFSVFWKLKKQTMHVVYGHRGVTVVSGGRPYVAVYLYERCYRRTRAAATAANIWLNVFSPDWRLRTRWRVRRAYSFNVDILCRRRCTMECRLHTHARANAHEQRDVKPVRLKLSNRLLSFVPTPTTPSDGWCDAELAGVTWSVFYMCNTIITHVKCIIFYGKAARDVFKVFGYFKHAIGSCAYFSDRGFDGNNHRRHRYNGSVMCNNILIFF